MTEPSRRTVLTAGLAAVTGAGAALGGRAVWDATVAAPQPSEPPTTGSVGRATVAFRGERQPGVGTPAPAFATLVAFDLLPGVDRAALVRLMRVWTDDIERLMAGTPPLADQSGELTALPASLTATVGYGPGFFAAAGLTHRAPSWAVPLPPFAVDRLEDRWSGGDLVLQLCADDQLSLAHAVRVLSVGASTFATPRWTQHGFRHAPGVTAPGATMRNLLGQLDGTRNVQPDVDPDLVWHTGPDDGWLAGGTSMVVRRIRMELDTWDVLDRGSREAALGRRLADGAPLTGSTETDVPDLEARDARGFTVIGPAAHVRRAAATTPRERFMRRPFNYLDPPEAGLLFITFQADPVAQLVPVQQRLAEADVLNIWTTPVGSAVFAVPPGARDGEYLGEGLLA